ncbi:MAG TPA: DNA topoisomerase IB [Bradyrhizobium sp.]
MAKISPRTRAGGTTAIIQELGLRYVTVDQLTLRRRRNGKGFAYLGSNGRPLRDQRTLYRLKRLAVPPAYEDVCFALDPQAHLQAIGRDSAGRTQYRYHPDWEKVREIRKARRLAQLVPLLPKIRAWVSRHLRDSEPTRELALAAMIELVACTALRAGSETYAQQNGTRGAATLLKSNIVIKGDQITLCFRGKSGKTIDKSVRSARLARALKRLLSIPGKRLFQYRTEERVVCLLRRRDVNAELRNIAGRRIVMKDFRTMIASSRALEKLAALEPKSSERGRRRQVLATIRMVAEDLANTPAVCRRSYVHAAVISAFESGALMRMAQRNTGSSRGGERILAQVIEKIAG